MSKPGKRKKVVIDAFICHGMDLPEGITSGNQQCDCPFCHEENHFFVDAATGQWDCKKCMEKGNVYTFLAKMAQRMHDEIGEERLRKLATLRGIPVKALRRYKIGWNGAEYTIPIYSEKGTVRDIRRWLGPGKGVWSTHFCKLQLGGLYELANSIKSQEVWICEGEWDAISMRWLLNMAGRKHDVVVWVPGAGSFQDEWVPWFEGRVVHCCYDNDDAGDKGAEKVEMMLKGTAKELDFLNWPDTRPMGYDLNDLVRESLVDGTPAREVMILIVGMLSPKRRRDITPSRKGEPATPGGPPEEPIPFGSVVEVFRKWLTMTTDFEDGLAICLAICLSNELRRDPLWLYLVGPAGSGKTVILMALNDSPRVGFYSCLTPASLVSGFNIHPDPSILPKLNGKTAIFKDATELLALHPEARNAIYGTLRGAYDGEVLRPFGHGLTRHYKDLHFNMIMGVTPEIHVDNQANMGERFLKYEIKEDVDIKSKIRQAIYNVAAEVDMSADLSSACRRFLLREPDPTKMPGLPELYIDRIVALAQLVALLRAQVSRESFGDREIKYRPVHETGTRVAKQMSKLARMLCHVYETPEVDERIYKIIRRVAMDTSTGFNVDVIKAMMNTGNPGLTREQIADAARMSKTTLVRKLEDLEQFDIVRRVRDGTRVRAVGVTPGIYYVSKPVEELWRIAWPGTRIAPPRPAPANGTALQRFAPKSGPAAKPKP